MSDLCIGFINILGVPYIASNWVKEEMVGKVGTHSWGALFLLLKHLSVPKIKVGEGTLPGLWIRWKLYGSESSYKKNRIRL